VSDDVAVEATGETVGEAKWKALRELERLAPGLDKASVEFQVVSEGERGLLGVGYTPARVVASARAGQASLKAEAAQFEPTPRRDDESELEQRVRELVERVVGALGIAAQVDARQSADELLVTCTGGDLGLLIGRHGQTIDSLQYLSNAILHREGLSASVTIDAAGYRDRRRATLEGIAVRAAERAVSGERIALEPMTAIERKVVHERLKNVEGVATLSEGAEPNRHIVVFSA
jgi:spoIIIJ-associated protein